MVRAIALLCLAGIGAVTVSAAAISGMVVYSADSTGAVSGTQFWNTLGFDSNPNLYVQVNGVLQNPGNGAGTSLNVNLSPGIYSYSYCGDGLTGQVTPAFFGVSIFMDGNNTTPAFTFFWQSGISNPTVLPTSALSRNVPGGFVGGAGGGPYVSGNTTVTILSVPTWQNKNLDKVSVFDSVAGDCPQDYCGIPASLMVVSQTIPEPGTLALVTLGLVTLLRRRR